MKQLLLEDLHEQPNLHLIYKPTIAAMQPPTKKIHQIPYKLVLNIPSLIPHL